MDISPDRKTDRILLIEDDEKDASLIRVMLSKDKRRRHNVQVAESLSQGLEKIDREKPDLVIADLGLPDSQGPATFRRLLGANPSLPVLILSGQGDDALAEEAVRCGAQDYIRKQDLDTQTLVRSVRYAFERSKLTQQMRQFLSTDDLTGLYNRKAFLTLARQQMKISSRKGTRNTVVFADLDDLKAINDTLGHSAGDRAISEIALILRNTFRDSDIIGRIGGDEFAVLVIDCRPGDTRTLLDRLRDRIRAYNETEKPSFPLSVSIGVAEAAPEERRDIASLLEEADRAMYEEKRRRKNARVPC